MGSSLQAYRDILSSSGLNANYCSSKMNDWGEALQGAVYIPVCYKSEILAYHNAYMGSDFVDLSLIIYHENSPVAVWPLTISNLSTKPELTSLGSSVLPPLFVENISIKTEKVIARSCLEFAHQICSRHSIKTWTSIEAFIDNSSSQLSQWHLQSMSDGASTGLKHGLYVDLSMGLASYKNSLRKSYKSLVTSGAKLWQVGIMSTGDVETWEAFRQLHIRVAGKSTRSLETWDIQHTAIEEQNAFLVHLSDYSGAMVGAGYFTLSANEANYSVAAYDRSLFKKPLGHVVQFTAVEEMMKREIRWYRLGAMNYPSEVPPPTEKELSIANFKTGFATHVMPEYSLTHSSSA